MSFPKRGRIDYQGRAEQASSASGAWNKTWRCGSIKEISVPFMSNVTVRVLPGLNPEDGGDTCDPMILPDGRFGEWICSFPVVSCGPDKHGITFIPLDDFDSPSPLESSPYKLAYRNVSNYKKAFTDGVKLTLEQLQWIPLLSDGGVARANTLSYISTHSFVQVLPYYVNGKVYAPEDQTKYLHVLRIKKMASEVFRDFISDYCIPNHVDITDWKAGPFITMWPAKLENPFNGEPGNPESKSYNLHHEVKFSRPGYAGASCDISRMKDQLMKMLRPWVEVINCASYTEQAGWLMEDVLPLDLLADSWRDKYYVKTAGGPDYAFLPFVSDKQAARLRQAYDPIFYGGAVPRRQPQYPQPQPQPQERPQYDAQRYQAPRNVANAAPQRQERYAGPAGQFGGYSDAYGAPAPEADEVSYAPAPAGYAGLEEAPFEADANEFKPL